MTALTLGNGSNDVLELVKRTFLTMAHEAVFSQRAFAVCPIITQAVGATASVAQIILPTMLRRTATIRRRYWL